MSQRRAPSFFSFGLANGSTSLSISKGAVQMSIEGATLFAYLIALFRQTGRKGSAASAPRTGILKRKSPRYALLRGLHLVTRSVTAAMYVYTTGVKYNVTNCENINPPTTARPSGRLASPPEP